jgi:hypothetical protein
MSQPSFDQFDLRLYLISIKIDLKYKFILSKIKSFLYEFKFNSLIYSQCYTVYKYENDIIRRLNS